MKLRVILPDDDVAFLDEYAAKHGLPSRSAALHRAVGRLRASELGRAYALAWQDSQTSDDTTLWDTTIADGLGTI